jgi:hypothetical protein
MLSVLIQFQQRAEIGYVAERALTPPNTMNLASLMKYFAGVSRTFDSLEVKHYKEKQYYKNKKLKVE